MQKKFMTLEQAATFLGISKSHLYKQTMAKTIPFYKPLGKIYFFQEDLEKFILSGKVKTQDETKHTAEKVR